MKWEGADGTTYLFVSGSFLLKDRKLSFPDLMELLL